MVEKTAAEIGAAGVVSDPEVVQGFGRRPRHAQPRRRRRAHVRHPGQGEHQHPDDLDLGDQGLGRLDAKYGELAVRALHRAFVEEDGGKTETDGCSRRNLRHDAARRLSGGGRRPHPRGQAAHHRAPRRASGIRYVEGGWPGSNPRDEAFFEEVRKLSLRRSPGRGLRLDPPRRSARRDDTQPRQAAALRDAGDHDLRQDLGPARARRPAHLRAKRTSTSSTTPSRT
jgi:hypothetical protein